jgi:hypothetical protein
MPGQPLATFPDVKSFTFGPGSVFKRPKLAPYIMLILEHWAFTEWGILRIGASCVGGDLTIATAMLQAVDSQAAQRSAILAAAKSMLDDEHWIIFEAAFFSILPSRAIRNKFAHHLWGVSNDLPDALILQDTRHANLELAKRVKRVQQRIADGVAPVFAGERDVNRGEMFVWREADFKKEVENAARAGLVISNLDLMIGAFQNGRATDSIRSRLLKDPLIQQRIQKSSPKT